MKPRSQSLALPDSDPQASACRAVWLVRSASCRQKDLGKTSSLVAELLTLSALQLLLNTGSQELLLPPCPSRMEQHLAAHSIDEALGGFVSSLEKVAKPAPSADV